MRILTDFIMLGFTLGVSIYDWKQRLIPVKFLWTYSAVAVLCAWSDVRIGGLLIGILFWLVSKITKEAIGYGDSWVITLLGMYLGGRDLIRLLFTASFLAAIVSLIWMWKQGWKREGSLPFVPFLTIGLMEVIFL